MSSAVWSSTQRTAGCAVWIPDTEASLRVSTAIWHESHVMHSKTVILSSVIICSSSCVLQLSLNLFAFIWFAARATEEDCMNMRAAGSLLSLSIQIACIFQGEEKTTILPLIKFVCLVFLFFLIQANYPLKAKSAAASSQLCTQKTCSASRTRKTMTWKTILSPKHTQEQTRAIALVCVSSHPREENPWYCQQNPDANILSEESNVQWKKLESDRVLRISRGTRMKTYHAWHASLRTWW